jgi:hypothetical protein
MWMRPGYPNRTMFPPSPGVAVLFAADYAGIQGAQNFEQTGSALPLLLPFLLL